MKCSMHTGKKYSLDHNLRTYDKEKWNNDGHIDYSRSELNQTFVSQPLYKFFDEQFGDALVEYNDKSREKHPERLIGFSSAKDYDDCPPEERRQRAVKAYYQEQKKKVQEVIIQLGNHEDYCALVADVGQEHADRLHADYLKEAFDRWKEENPSLAPFCAVTHFDETKDGSPHLHVDYIPIAESTRGLSRKVSMDGALKQIGYERKKQHKYSETPYKQWLRTYRALQEQAAQEFVNRYDYGLSIEPSEPSKAEHEQPQDFKLRQAEQKRKEVEQEIKPLQAELDGYKQLKTDTDSVVLEKKKVPFSKNVIVSAEKLDRTEQQAASYVANRDEIENIRERQAAIEAGERQLAEQRRRQQTYEQKKKKEIAEKEEELASLKAQYQAAYEQQLDLNGYVEQLRHIISLKDEEIGSLTAENGSLRLANTQLSDKVSRENESVVEAYSRLTDVIQAVNMLRIEHSIYYAGLSEDSEDLLTAISECSEKWVIEERLSDFANEMWKGSISKEIQDKIDEINPPALSQGYHYHR